MANIGVSKTNNLWGHIKGLLWVILRVIRVYIRGLLEVLALTAFWPLLVLSKLADVFISDFRCVFRQRPRSK